MKHRQPKKPLRKIRNLETRVVVDFEGYFDHLQPHLETDAVDLRWL